MSRKTVNSILYFGWFYLVLMFLPRQRRFITPQEACIIDRCVPVFSVFYWLWLCSLIPRLMWSSSPVSRHDWCVRQWGSHHTIHILQNPRIWWEEYEKWVESYVAGNHSPKSQTAGGIKTPLHKCWALNYQLVKLSVCGFGWNITTLTLWVMCPSLSGATLLQGWLCVCFQLRPLTR